MPLAPADGKEMKMAKTLALAIGLTAAVALFAARPHQRAAAQFDYYVLSLSWAPDFCAQAGANQPPSECGAGRHVGFVVHGLWPQNNSGKGPENCGAVAPVSQSIVNAMLNFFPTASLIQHEWSAHGSCSGLSASDYFAGVRNARNAVQIPAEFGALTKPTQATTAQIEAEFAAANPRFPPKAFRATCTRGMLQEARICLSKTLSPQSCTASAGECASPGMTILPPR
jgi:ribonuclease T2